MAHYLITFNKQISNDKNLFGFKIFDSKQASLYMHCVNLLSQEAIVFDGGSEEYQYFQEDFESIKLTSSEVKTLCKLFYLDFLNESSIVGIFPDAINDAYDNNLVDEDENEDDIEDIDEY